MAWFRNRAFTYVLGIVLVSPLVCLRAMAQEKPPLQLPDLYSGVPYSTPLFVPTVSMGEINCAPLDPPLPGSLKFTCGNKILLAGSVKIKKSVSVHGTLHITDAGGRVTDFDFKLNMIALGEIFDPTKPLPPATPNPTPQAPDYSKIRILPTKAAAEGGSEIAGDFTPAIPDGATAKLNLRVRGKPDGGQDDLLDLVTPGAAANAATVTHVQLTSGANFKVTFARPLAPGQTLRVEVVDPEEVVIKSDPYVLSSRICLPRFDLRLYSEPVPGSVISGKINMPAFLVAPDPKATPPSQGNYPRIAASLEDADLGLGSQAQLTAPDGSAVTTLPVTYNGEFSFMLKAPLKAGQKVRVSVVPPDGRSFACPANGPDPIARPPEDASSKMFVVRSSLTLAQPGIASVLSEGATTLNGVATPSGTAGTMSVAVLRVDERAREANALSDPDKLEEQTDVCLTADLLTTYNGHGKHGIPLAGRGTLLPAVSSGSNVLLTTVTGEGTWKVTLAEPLKQDDRIQIVQVLPAGTELAKSQRNKCASNTQVVRYVFDWHRINVTFVAGVLISNSSSTSAASANFSQANQFYAINVERAWRLPGADCLGPTTDSTGLNLNTRFGRQEYGSCRRTGWHSDKFPGISTFFEGRLSAIPVSTASTTATSPTPAPAAGGTTMSSGSTLLTSQKVFRVATGAYFPWVLTHDSGHHPNGIFLAPLAKAGFDTISGSGILPNVNLGGGSTGTIFYQTAYNNFSFGGRLGNAELSSSHDRAPKIVDYLDVTIGRYSNLQSYICHQAGVGRTPTTLTGSTCSADYPQFFAPGGSGTPATPIVDSRKQLFRLDLEGLIKIPMPASVIPFYIGFNANIAQHTVGAQGLDHGYAPPDDIRILFGTKIDIGSLLSNLNLGTH